MKEQLPKIIGGVVNATSYLSPTLSGRLALKIFSSPKKGRVTTEEAKFLDKAEQLKLSHPEGDVMTYKWANNGKTALLAHGWESNSFRWKGLIEKMLNEGYQVIALDAPAHGQSGGKSFNALIYSDFIKIVMDHFEPEFLIGHSVGGMASIFYQHKNADHRLEKMVLLGAPSNFTGVFQRYRDLLGYNQIVEKSMSRIIQKEFGHPPDYFKVANFNGFSQIEGLIIHDKRDLIIPYEDAHDIKAHFPNSSFISTEGYGHGLKQDEVNTHILNFLNKG